MRALLLAVLAVSSLALGGEEHEKAAAREPAGRPESTRPEDDPYIRELQVTIDELGMINSGPRPEAPPSQTGEVERSKPTFWSMPR